MHFDEDVVNVWRTHDKLFLCPNGHTVSFTKLSATTDELELAREEVVKLTKQLEAANETIIELKSELEIWCPSDNSTTKSMTNEKSNTC